MPDFRRYPRRSNPFRSKLYERLLPRIIEEDQNNLNVGFVEFWTDGADEVWTDGSNAVWGALGVFPVIQQLFYSVESQEDADLDELESLKDLISPDRCPVQMLPFMARGLGLEMPAGMPEAQQRAAIRGIGVLNKKRSIEQSWAAFFRMLDFDTSVKHLWKKDIHEANDDYSQSRFTSTPDTTTIATAGATRIIGATDLYPVKPGTVVISDGVEVLRDVAPGVLEGNLGGSGRFDYEQGRYDFSFASPAATDVTIQYEAVTGEWPYPAARVDFELILVPISGGPPATVDEAFVRTVLAQIEQVRPIHVLVRSLALVLPLEDTVSPMARDDQCVCCGPSIAKDIRATEQRWYFGDGFRGLHNAELVLEYEDAGTPVTEVVLGPEIIPFTLAPLDSLAVRLQTSAGDEVSTSYV